MSSRSFVTPFDWGGRGGGERKSGVYHQKKKDDVERINLPFLPMVGEETIHHEPPIFEARPRIRIRVDHAGHAAIHWKRWKMYNKQQDYDAYSGQVSLMNEDESDNLERMKDSDEIMGLIGKEIKRRRQ